MRSCHSPKTRERLKNPSDYRLICLLNTVGKLVKIIKKEVAIHQTRRLLICLQSRTVKRQLHNQRVVQSITIGKYHSLPSDSLAARCFSSNGIRLFDIPPPLVKINQNVSLTVCEL